MNTDLVPYRICVANTNYHLVWSVKYRRTVLSSEVEQYLQEIAREKGFTVHQFDVVNRDHVHCFVTAPPKLPITNIVKYLKGISRHKVFEGFPEIKEKLWKGRLWNPSRCVETVGSIPEDAIRKYIEQQKKE